MTSQPPDGTPIPTQAIPQGERMDYLPLFLDVKDRPCLVIGEGSEAAQKSLYLARAGAAVCLVAECPCPALREMIAAGEIDWIASTFKEAQMAKAALCIADVDEPHPIARIKAAAQARNVLYNIVDKKEHCQFIVPAIVNRAPIVIAISTAGAAPILAKALRRYLESALPEGLGRLAETTRIYRAALHQRLPNMKDRFRFWRSFFGSHSLPTLAALSEQELIAKLQRAVRLYRQEQRRPTAGPSCRHARNSAYSEAVKSYAPR